MYPLCKPRKTNLWSVFGFSVFGENYWWTHRPNYRKIFWRKRYHYSWLSRTMLYDGAPNMQSLKKGAASYILKKFPKAYTTHCCSHSLNLSLASTCKIPIITNIYKSVLIYFDTSPKRENLLIHIVEQKCFSEERKKV